jgi:hypothetical protein
MAVRERLRAAIKSRDLATVIAALEEGNQQKFKIFEMKVGNLCQWKIYTPLTSTNIPGTYCATQALVRGESVPRNSACLVSIRSRRKVRQWILDCGALVHNVAIRRYKEYESALADAVRLELTGEKIVELVQIKFKTVKDRIDTKANLEKGIRIGDKDLILKSLAKAAELEKDWGPIVSPEAVAQAQVWCCSVLPFILISLWSSRLQVVLEVIAREERVTDELRAALGRGAAGGVVGAVDTSCIDTSGLDAVIASSQGATISTIAGQNLVKTAQVCRFMIWHSARQCANVCFGVPAMQKVRELRKAFIAGNWDGIEEAVAVVAAMRASGDLAAESESEVKKAEAEVADRRIVKGVNNALQVRTRGSHRLIIIVESIPKLLLTSLIFRRRAAPRAAWASWP